MLKISPRRAAKLASPSESGFLLPMVVITGLIIGAGITALSTRTFAGLIGSIRQGQSRESKEAAETGLMQIQRELNRSHPYLLTSNCNVDPITIRCIVGATGQRQDWIPTSAGGTWEPIASICPASSQNAGDMQNKLSGTLQGGRSRYQLISYNFDGDEIQGGIGRFKIKGESYISNSSTNRRATSIIEQSVSIIPKSCNCPPYSPTCPTGFAGLLANEIDFKNSDLYGSVNANIVCRLCLPGTKSEVALAKTPDGINLSRVNGVVEGDIYGGKVVLPPVPTFPGNKPEDPNPSVTERAVITSNATFAAGNVPANPACYVDNTPDKTTHCLISRINLSGTGSDKQLCIFSSPQTNTFNPCGGPDITVSSEFKGGIRFYFDQTDADAGGQIINVSGQGKINHLPSTNPEQLGFFGRPSTGDNSTTSQSITYRGGGSSLALFMYFPDAKIQINGGSSTPDIEGAIWGKVFDGSGNNVEIRVPANMGSLLWLRYGNEFVVGVREYTALGTTDWRTTQLPGN